MKSQEKVKNTKRGKCLTIFWERLFYFWYHL
jgi:hypothetical protein